MSTGALAGVRVVELSSELGAFAGKLLADMGADVILVEPPGGDPTRAYPPFADDVPGPESSLFWWHYQTSKRGVVLDLDDPSDRARLRALIGQADVLLECEPPDRLAALELDWPDLSALRPDLVMASITGFGRSGGDEAFTDLTLLAKGGPVWSCGYDDHSIPPVRGGGNQAYNTACHYAVMSILTALLHREVSGRGQHIDVNAYAAANVTTEMASYHWLVQQGTVQRQTGRHALETPSMETQFACADGHHVTTSIPPREPAHLRFLHDWIAELGGLGEFPEAIFLAQGAERDSALPLDQLGTDETVTAIFAAGREGLAFVASRVSAYEFFERTQQAGLQTGVVYAPEEAFEDPHFVARGFPTRVEHDGRVVDYPGAPYKFEKTPWRIQRRAPKLGEHDDEILGALPKPD
jgi:crotonobetainyl-CoA:carnitine CoA-transferase CaiB-like acyl-CoA transferase